MTLTEIKTAVANAFEIAVADLTVLSQDMFLVAVNQVRKQAELKFDFEFSRKLVDLTIDGITGGSLDDVTLSGIRASSLSVAGTLNSAPTGTYHRSGLLLNEYPVFMKLGANTSTSGILWYKAADSRWQLETFANYTEFGGYYSLSSTSPVGSYTGTLATGTPVVTVVNDFTVKSIIDIGSYDDFGNMRPLEWTTVAESLERQRGDNPYLRPRYPTDGEWRSGPLGLTRLEVSGNNVFLFRKSEQASVEIEIGLEVYTFQNDWTSVSGVDDIWTKHAHQYLLWGSIVYLNHTFKHFVFRQEGNLPPPEKLRDEGLAAFVEWDVARFEGNRRHGR